MRHLFHLVIFILLAGVLLSSCSDVAMFTPSVKESVGVSILSLSEGDFLTGDDPIDFIIQTENQSTKPELLEITLVTVSERGVEQSVWNTSISSPLTDEALELLLPDLETGQYTIVFSVLDEEGTKEEEKTSFFYIKGKYAIQGITSYPTTTTAGHETVLEADLLYPDQGNPYVRWSQDDIVLATGSVAEGLQKITWMAPQEDISFGIGWYHINDKGEFYYQHQGLGPGYRTIIRIYPKYDISFVILTSQTETDIDSWADRLINDVKGGLF